VSDVFRYSAQPFWSTSTPDLPPAVPTLIVVVAPVTVALGVPLVVAAPGTCTPPVPVAVGAVVRVPVGVVLLGLALV
jgi:hypothetical protein